MIYLIYKKAKLNYSHISYGLKTNHIMFFDRFFLPKIISKYKVIINNYCLNKVKDFYLMKFKLLVILIITILICHSDQLLKRSVKVETKTDSQNTTENSEMKSMVTNLNSNKINVNDEKTNKSSKEKVYYFYLFLRKV